MQNLTKLAKAAINAAKNTDWNQAVKTNQKILEIQPKSIDALNRLALAQMQLDRPQKAQTSLKKVLQLDPHNKIAEKNLAKIKKNQKGRVKFSKNNFIEEPGKAKNVKLIRLTDDKLLDETHVGQACQLEPKSTYISVVTSENKDYLGTLPKKISARLIKLIQAGNKYACFIQSCSSDKCCVHIKELKVSEKNQNKTSFALEKNGATDDFDDEKMLENIPMNLVNTDTDVEAKEINPNKVKTD
jgi:tetratricopeptide (TPR) repeat protein